MTLLLVFALAVLMLALANIQVLHSRIEDLHDEWLHAVSDLARKNEELDRLRTRLASEWEEK